MQLKCLWMGYSGSTRKGSHKVRGERISSGFVSPPPRPAQAAGAVATKVSEGVEVGTHRMWGMVEGAKQTAVGAMEGV